MSLELAPKLELLPKKQTGLKLALSCQDIVDKLNLHIVGQMPAKRAVAIALRNRSRRLELEPELAKEITPKNILMIGPTGVGKTEIARRLAQLARAPFIKVEATKFTEVGFVGRDVDSIIRDLLDVAIKKTREEALEAAQPQAEQRAEERILDALVPKIRRSSAFNSDQDEEPYAAREIFRDKLRKGELDETEISIEVSHPHVGVEIMSPPGMEEMTQQLQHLFQSLSGEKKRTRKLLVKHALRLLTEEEASKLVDEDDIKRQAIEQVEQNGIVFIDEIDKVCSNNQRQSYDVSREGVQRDLLPLVEGCSINTKHGTVHTDHILFIASGAFHLSKPSDLVPELQGRLPIRVELTALNIEDFQRILTEPNASLTTQYQAMLATDGMPIKFTDDGISKIAQLAWEINERLENIGARRLHTVIEKLFENLSFLANGQDGLDEVIIDGAYVESQLKELIKDQDLQQYVL